MGVKEIADRVGVSPTTVSLALNGRSGVGVETRKKILRIAEEMNYRIPEKRVLPRVEHGTIQFLKLSKHGEILNQDLNIFIADYIDGIDHVARQLGFKFEISSHVMTEINEVLRETARKKMQGMIVLGTELLENEVAALEAIPVPKVVIDTSFEDVSMDFVNMNNISALFRIAGYFSEKGHRSAGMVTSIIPSGNVFQREKGFLDAAGKFSLDIVPGDFIRVRPSFDQSRIDMLAYLDSGGAVPEALFCCNDIIAYGCIKALGERGYSVPGDISVAGFDDLPLSSMMEPRLTTVRVSKKQIGTMAMQLLVDKIESGNVMHNVSIQVDGNLVERDSVGNRKDMEI